MFSNGYKLTSPFDFDNAMYFSAYIEVWQNGVILDEGIITAHKDESVFIDNDGGYLKELCEFIVIKTPKHSPRS